MTGAPFRIKRHPREALVVHINSNYQLPHPICAHNMKCHQTMRFLGRALRTKETWSADVESYSTHPRSPDCGVHERQRQHTSLAERILIDP